LEVVGIVEVEQGPQVAALVRDLGDQHVHRVPAAGLGGGGDVRHDDDAGQALPRGGVEALVGHPHEVAEGLPAVEDGLHVGQARRGAEPLVGAGGVTVDGDELEEPLGTDDLDGAHAEAGPLGGVARQGVHEGAGPRITPAEVARPALPSSHLPHGPLAPPQPAFGW
jgi:hypothetical protein